MQKYTLKMELRPLHVNFGLFLPITGETNVHSCKSAVMKCAIHWMILCSHWVRYQGRC